MGVRVFGNRDKAGMYDGTTGALIGTVYKGEVNAERELNEFVNEWIEGSPRDDYQESVLPDLFVAYKVEKGFLDKVDWESQVRTAENVLDREADIEEGRIA